MTPRDELLAQASSEEAAFSEWNSLDRLAKQAAAQTDASPARGKGAQLIAGVDGQVLVRAAR